MVRAAVLVIGMFCAACTAPPPLPLEEERPQPRTAQEIEFARATLNALQPASFENNREYCGYIGLDASGSFIASPAAKGRRDSCAPKDSEEIITLIASYHTHGAYSSQHDSEVPSYEDLVSDIDEGVDGYIATPGGRFWFSDARAGEVVLLCEEACLLADPDYRHDAFSEVELRYSLEDLE